MSQNSKIEGYLNKIIKDFKVSEYSTYLYLYEDVDNESMKIIFSYYHNSFNNLFNLLNEKKGQVGDSGYLRAEDSRYFISVMDEFDTIYNNLQNSEFSFEIINREYLSAKNDAREFVQQYGGSHIPSSFNKIKIEETAPIFALINSHKVIIQSEYPKLKYIGEGSYANVYKYVDCNLNCPIVLKRAKKDLDEKETTRFKNEFDTLKNLKSPYIVEVYAYNDDKVEYTMEYLDYTIDEFIKKYNDKMDIAFRKNLSLQLCRALKYIHSKNLLHRDISLKNIFLKKYDDCFILKLADFGLVKLPNSNLTTINTEFKGSLNDPDLKKIGFNEYEIRHETYALTYAIHYILTGKTTSKSSNQAIEDFLTKGTNSDITERFKNVDEVENYIKTNIKG